MFYDRKIKYLDYYEDGVRVRGGGFVKLEARDTSLRLEVTVSGLYRNDSFTRDVVILGRGQEHVIGKIMISGGRGQYRQAYQNIRDIAETGMGYQELEGIYILLGAGRELSCNWPSFAGGEAEEGGKRNGSQGELSGGREGRKVRERGQNGKSDGGGKIVKEERRERRMEEENSYGGAKEGGREEASGNIGGIKGIDIEDRIQEETGRRGQEGLSEEREYHKDVIHEDENNRTGIGEDVYEKYEAATEESRNGEMRMVERAGSGNEMAGGGRSAEKGTGRENGVARGKAGMGKGRNGGCEAGRNAGRGVGNHQENRNNMQRGKTIIQEPAVNERERNSGMEQQRETGKPVKLLEDKWTQLCAIYPHIHPFRDKREYLSIGPADFVLFPAASYKMVNNSFLLHGYYNYHHLILARVEQKGEYRYYIGVPGGYFEKEKQVAIMFGFESFECETEPAQTGDFGYYMMRTEL
ncbi:MAG: hypothetical protein HFH82_14700 [Lachnospiraceae bacterium]|nr:hypothetical protein [Lachnospiraceae bacterium]